MLPATWLEPSISGYEITSTVCYVLVREESTKPEVGGDRTEGIVLARIEQFEDRIDCSRIPDPSPSASCGEVPASSLSAQTRTVVLRGSAALFFVCFSLQL